MGTGCESANKMEDESYEISSLMLDMGSSTYRAGWIGEDKPHVVFPMVSGRAKGQRTAYWEPGCYLGYEALDPLKGELQLAYPMRHGVIYDLEKYEEILYKSFYNELRIAISEHPIILSESVMAPPAIREKQTQIMFETFNPGAYLPAFSSVLPIFTTGKMSGLSVDLGESLTTLAVYEGFTVRSSVTRSHFGGARLTEDFAHAMKKDEKCNFDFTKLKEKKCYVVQDYQKELKIAKENPKKIQFDEAGPEVILKDQLFSVPEALFQPLLSSTFFNEDKFPIHYDQRWNIQYPSLLKRIVKNEGLFSRIPNEIFSSIYHYEKTPTLGLNGETLGIHEMVFNSVMACEADFQSELLKNIVLSGGSSMFPGLVERLETELKLLFPGKEIKIVADEDRTISCWKGGSVLGSLLPDTRNDGKSHCWITREDYDEVGPKLVHSMAF